MDVFSTSALSSAVALRTLVCLVAGRPPARGAPASFPRFCERVGTFSIPFGGFLVRLANGVGMKRQNNLPAISSMVGGGGSHFLSWFV